MVKNKRQVRIWEIRRMKVEISYLMAASTLSILLELERQGIKLGGLTQDWQEVMKKYE